MYAFRRRYDQFLAFLQRHERPLATAVFVGGFITDLLTFGLLSLQAVSLLLGAYLVFVMLATVVAHWTYGNGQTLLRRSLSVLAPLAAQFVFGSLLSGFLILYTKSAVLSISWPFLLLLALVFLGNEVLRNYRSHLIFQTLLLFFSLYAYAVFAVPLYSGKIGTSIFLASTALTVLAFTAYLLVLSLVNRARLQSALKPIIGSTALVTTAVVLSYLAGLLPPLPLTLKDGGVYHSIVREGGGYVVQGERERFPFDPRPQVVQHVPGTPLYAYSAIFAPGSFSASVVHVWQRYDEDAGAWRTQSTVAFSVSGGREGGYRGYSLKGDPQPGKWRVLVQTMNGQTIGNFRFTVESVPSLPSLQTTVL